MKTIDLKCSTDDETANDRQLNSDLNANANYSDGSNFNCLDSFAFGKKAVRYCSALLVSLPREKRQTWLAGNKAWNPYILSCRRNGRSAKWFRRRLLASTRCRAWDNRVLCTPASQNLPREPSCRSRSPPRWSLAVLLPPKTRSANAGTINYDTSVWVRVRVRRGESVECYEIYNETSDRIKAEKSESGGRNYKLMNSK